MIGIYNKMPRVVAALLCMALPSALGGSCTAMNNCNGQGTCDTVNSKCNCFSGWGSSSDVSVYKAPDCSLRVCPSDAAWVDIPTGQTTAHAAAECSNAGICDRTTGRCRCFAGFEGEACQRSACPGSPPCSGHGKCVSMSQMATEANAVPFGGAYSYGGSESSATWDENKIFGCVCDSAWTVGYGSGEYQATQWFGADCSLKHCPGADDPRTTLVDESDCEWYDDNGATWRGYVGANGVKYKTLAALTAAGTTVATAPAATAYQYGGAYLSAGQVPNAGAAGNKCFVECSNRGTCDYGTGSCSCFSGYGGSACEIKLLY